MVRLTEEQFQILERNGWHINPKDREAKYIHAVSVIEDGVNKMVFVYSWEDLLEIAVRDKMDRASS